MNRNERIAIAAVAVFVVVALIDIYAKWRDCKDAGGVLVLGVFRYECVAACALSKP